MKKLFVIGLISLTVNAIAIDNNAMKQRSQKHWNVFLSDLNKSTKKPTVASKSKKVRPASPARNAMIFNNLLQQAEDKLVDNNIRVDQQYAQKALWKTKDRIKKEMPGLNNQLDHKLDKKLHDKLRNTYRV